MLRRTKIIATLGPATASESALKKLLCAGVDMVRLNFSHGTAESHIKQARLVRKIAKDINRVVAVMGDLQGPKIRIACFQKGSVELKEGQDFCLDFRVEENEGDSTRVGLSYPLALDTKMGDILLLDDGRMSLQVEDVEGEKIYCKVVQGGELSNHKGINLLGGGLNAPSLTSKDQADIKLAAQIQVDYLAVSFVRSAADMIQARELYQQAHGPGYLLAKIERAELVQSQDLLEGVIRASDAVMVARGDLGVEIGDAELVGVQKNIIATARRLNCPVITATQMMESMIESSMPTRAEVFDVANAVLDGTDGVMLSAETAMGHCPHAVVAAMERICLGAERHNQIDFSPKPLDEHFNGTDEAIATAAMYAANHMSEIRAIVCLTSSGNTTLWMSRINSGLPIFALSRRELTRRRLALFRGVYSLPFEVASDHPDIVQYVVTTLLDSGYLSKGDKIILTLGACSGVTSMMKILKI